MKNSLSFTLLMMVVLSGVTAQAFQVGQIKKAQSADGVSLRAEPKPLAAVTARVARLTECTILAIEGHWLYLSCEGGKMGWAPGNEFAEPGKLTAMKTQVAPSSTSDFSIAGRQ